MANTFRGNHPQVNQDWVVIAELKDPEHGRWILYKRAMSNAGGWTQHKLVAAQWANDKANYWFGRHDDGPIHGQDLGKMVRHRRELYHRLLETLGYQKRPS